MLTTQLPGNFQISGYLNIAGGRHPVTVTRLLWPIYVIHCNLRLPSCRITVNLFSLFKGKRAVPREYRAGSLAIGATKWQTVRHIVLPQALPGVITGKMEEMEVSKYRARPPAPWPELYHSLSGENSAQKIEADLFGSASILSSSI
ncbi:MAG: ABC transporter permease subunit [Chloroflexi bacterium]|nr:ABC transporter permease subunit [Chloroflexota bacterium]